MKYDFVIVGAGIYGATLANLLTSVGKSVLVIDKRPHIGGNCYTETEDKIEVHKYGAHIFHTNNEMVWKFVNRHSDFYPYIHTVIANSDGVRYNLPFNLNTFNKLWNISTPNDATRKILEELRAEESLGNKYSEDEDNLESFAISQVGRTIYEKFIKGYTEKQWGRPCSELPSSIIKRIPIRLNFNNNYFDDRYQGIPTKGYTNLIKSMLKDVKVELNCDFIKHRNEFEYDKLIYTGSIDEFLGYRFGKLGYRSLKFQTYKYDQTNYLGNSVVNYVDSSVQYTRIIEHKNFLPTDPNPFETIITVEYPTEFKGNGDRYYPIETTTNLHIYSEYINMASKLYPNVIFGGRLGSYKYLDMDDAILAAFNTFKGLSL